LSSGRQSPAPRLRRSFELDEEKIIETAVASCKKAGADGWEIYYLRSELFSAESREGELENLEARVSRGVALRVRSGGRTGFSYTARLGREAMEKAAEAAVAGAKVSDPDPEGDFAPPDGEPPGPDLWDEDFAEAEQAEKIERAMAVEAAARDFDERIEKVRSAAYSESSRSIRIVNHLGLDRTARANFCSASVMAVAREGDESQSGWAVEQSPVYKGLSYEEAGRRAAADAVKLLGGAPITTRKAPAILRNTAACEVLEVLGDSFSGEMACKGKSMLAGKTGERIFSPLLTIVDDGLARKGPASFPFDGEGVPRRSTTLVEGGVLKGFLYDLKWARKSGASSTGNAARGGYTAPPRPSISNLIIAPGEGGLDDLVKTMSTGLVAAELMGVHTANPVTGDFSVGANGWWYENGELVQPVQGVTIAGNILDLLGKVQVVGGDFRWLGGVGAPSLLVPELDISGE